jgi:hypothetical protein
MGRRMRERWFTWKWVSIPSAERLKTPAPSPALQIKASRREREDLRC